MAPVPSCAAELPTLFQAVLLGVPAAGGQGWVAGAEAPPFCGRCPPATWLLLITLGTAAHTPQGPAHSPPRPAAPAGTAPPRAGPLQERWMGGAPRGVHCGVYGGRERGLVLPSPDELDLSVASAASEPSRTFSWGPSSHVHS